MNKQNRLTRRRPWTHRHGGSVAAGTRICALLEEVVASRISRHYSDKALLKHLEDRDTACPGRSNQIIATPLTATAMRDSRN